MDVSFRVNYIFFTNVGTFNTERLNSHKNS